MRRPLRKAGVALLRADEAYAKRIADMYGVYDPKSPMGKSMLGLILGGAPARTAVAASDAESQIGRLADRVGAAGMAASSLGARYGAPAAGVALAGKGLYDITQSLMSGQQTSGELMPS